jgi:soluble cytochrome b562
MLLSYLKRIEQRLIALERVNNSEVEEDEEDEPFYDPDFPNMTKQGWKNLVAALDESQRQIDRGEVYSLEETVAHARAAVAKVREAKSAVPA